MRRIVITRPSRKIQEPSIGHSFAVRQQPQTFSSERILRVMPHLVQVSATAHFATRQLQPVVDRLGAVGRREVERLRTEKRIRFRTRHCGSRACPTARVRIELRRRPGRRSRGHFLFRLALLRFAVKWAQTRTVIFERRRRLFRAVNRVPHANATSTAMAQGDRRGWRRGVAAPSFCTAHVIGALRCARQCKMLRRNLPVCFKPSVCYTVRACR